MQQFFKGCGEFFLVLGGFFFLACNSQGTGSNNYSMDSAQNLNKTRFSDSPQKQAHADYLMKVYIGGLYEINASELAMSHSSNKVVKDLAQDLLRAHAKINGTIKNLTDSLQMTLPADLSQDRKVQLGSLNGQHGISFDVNYLKQMAADHIDAVNVLNQAITSNDSSVVQWAKKTLPLMEEHLNQVKACQSKLDSL